MMLTHIEVHGFKSLRNVIMDLGEVSVLIGPNGSGKSSLIQALGVLKQSLRHGGLLTSGPLVDIGGFNDVVSRGNTEISISVTGKSRIDGELFAKLLGPAEYRYDLLCDQKGLVSQDAYVTVDRFSFGGEWNRGQPVPSNKIESSWGTIDYSPNSEIGVPIRYLGGSPGKGKEKEYQEAEETVMRIFALIERDLRSISIVPACRGLDRPSYALESGPRQDIMDSSGASVQASHLASTIAYRSQIEERISEHVSRITGIKVKHRLVPDKQVSLGTHKEINIVNEGFGTNQLVHIFAQIETSPPESLIAIEEPEIHLHPKAQADMAEVLVDVAKQENKHLLISTHSEHLLFRLLTCVASRKIDPEDLSIHYFELEEGFTKTARLDVDKNGRLSGGLRGFFETDLEEFGRFLGARKE